MLRKVFFVPAVMLLFCLVYLFAPVPVEPVSWSAPKQTDTRESLLQITP